MTTPRSSVLTSDALMTSHKSNVSDAPSVVQGHGGASSTSERSARAASGDYDDDDYYVGFTFDKEVAATTELFPSRLSGLI